MNALKNLFGAGSKKTEVKKEEHVVDAHTVEKRTHLEQRIDRATAPMVTASTATLVPGAQLLNASSEEVAVQKVFEQPIMVETKQYQPAIVEKTLEADAIVRKTEKVEASLQRREWVEMAPDAKPTDIAEATIVKSAPHEVSSQILTGKTATAVASTEMGDTARVASRQIENGAFTKIEEKVMATSFLGEIDLRSSAVRKNEFIARDASAMAAHNGGIVFKELTSESVPITIERTFEKPVTVETKTFQPVVIEKTSEQEALKRVVETLPAKIERREWVETADSAKIVSAEEDLIRKTELREVESRLDTTVAVDGKIAPARTVVTEIEKGAMHEVAEAVVPLDELKLRESTQPGLTVL
jgi:hypothetical protein